MKIKVYILIILITIIIARILLEIQDRRKEGGSSEVRVLYQIDQQSTSCTFVNDRYLLETSRCEPFKKGDFIEIVGRVGHSSDKSLFAKKRLMIETIILVTPQRYSLMYWKQKIVQLRTLILGHITEVMEQQLTNRQTAVLQSMVFGFKDNLSAEIQGIFRKTGTTHLQAVSGYNFSVLFAGIYQAVQNRARKQVQGIVILSFVLAFMFLVGGQPSVIRAGISLITILCSKFMLIRQHNSIFSLVLVFILMLFWNPWWFFSISFQLSMVATCGIICLPPIFKVSVDKLLGLRQFQTLKLASTAKMIIDPFIVGVSAAVVTAPLLLFYFKELNLLGVVLTAATTSLVSYIVQVGFWSCFIAPLVSLLKLFLFFKLWLLASLTVPLEIFIVVLRYASQVDSFVVRSENFNLLFLLSSYLFLSGLVIRYRHLIWKSNQGEELFLA